MLGNSKLRRVLLLVLILTTATHFPAFAASASSRVFVLDSGATSLRVFDAATAEAVGSVALEGNPIGVMQIPRLRKLAVFDRGPGKNSFAFGWQSSGKTSLDFIDLTSLKKSSRLELCWGTGTHEVTTDGKRLAVVCPGVALRKGRETKPAELAIVNTEAETLLSRIPLSGPTELLLPPDNRTLVAFTHAYRGSGKKGVFAPAELIFVNLETGAQLDSPRAPANATAALISADGQYLYCLDPGVPSEKADKNVNGILSVISMARRTRIAEIDVGSNPQGLFYDRPTDRLLILSDAAPGSDGYLRAFRGSASLATSRVAHYPLFLRASPDRSLLYVVSTDSVSVLDFRTLQPSARIVLEKGDDERGDKTEVSEFSISPDGTRGFAVYSNSSKVSVLDLVDRKPMATVTTGRTSVKIVRHAAAGLNTYNSMQAGQGVAASMGVPLYTYQVYSVDPAHQAIEVSSDSRTAYVNNTETYDITVVDAKKAEVVSKIGLQERALAIELLADGKILAAPGPTTISFLDTTSNEKIKFDDEDYLRGKGLLPFISAFRLSPSGSTGILVAQKNVIFLEVPSMKVKSRVTDFENALAVLFENP